ncbi:MAG TPA: MFS transporter [Candidatus Izemoplasmatales bacterium]|nr:MFS transporter [Candidatus Izemoplasmatales bacterium]
MDKHIKKINQKIYYGWIIVFVSNIAFFMSAPGQTYSISVFVNTYESIFPYSSTLISSLYSVATILSGSLLYFMGRASDKYGPRRMMMLAGFMLALSAFFSSYVSNVLMIFISFFLLRYFGQGSLTLLPNALVPQWFEKNRALAISLSTIGGLVATMLIPSFNLWMIQSFGWQTAWRIWSMILVIIFIPLVYFFGADKPEQFDIEMENQNKLSSDAHQDNLKKIDKESFSLSQAFRTKEFWIAGVISMIPSMFTTGMTFHFYNIMDLRSISNESAAMIIGLIALPSFIIPFIAKPLIDKQPVKRILSITLLMMMISMFILMTLISNRIHAILFILFYGLAIAIQAVTLNVLWPNYYGRKHLGSIRGTATVFMVIGSALGPLPFGISYDTTGHYNIAIIAMMIFAGLCFVGSFAIDKPKKI